MIKIKNYIFNENEIREIKQCKNYLRLDLTYSGPYLHIDDATFDDIEWNYGTPQETQRQMQKDIDIREKEATKKLEKVDSEVKKAVNDYKIELYNLFDSITGTLPKYKIKYVIQTGDILHIDERAKKE